MQISNFKLAIGIPCSYPSVPIQFFESFIKIDRPTFIPIIPKSGAIDQLRNYIVATALDKGCTHLLMMDTDQEYSVNVVTKLMSHKLPVVHCAISRRYPPFDRILYEGELGKYITKTDYKDGDLIEVDACGTGCVMYQTKVFQDIPYPWFEFTEFNGKTVGEDIGFCNKLKKAGYKIFVDTSIEIVHLAPFGITKEFGYLYQALLKNQFGKEKLDQMLDEQING